MDNTCGRVSAVESASDSPAIAVVGTGRVASALVRTISEGGFCRLRQYGRSGDVLPPGQLAHDASDGLDAVVVAVADSAVAAVAEQLGRLEGNPLCVHTSGSVDMGVMAPMSSRIGVLYPLMTFNRSTPVTCADVPFFTEACDSAVLERVDALAAMFSAIAPRHADTAVRRTLHLAGVFTNNFVNVLLESTERILAADGLTLECVRPLLEATVANAVASGPHDSQTGPAVRGDRATIELQLDSLPAELKDVYRSLTTLIETYHR